MRKADTDNVEDGVNGADVRQEGVAEALALRGALDQAGDVDHGQVRRHARRRLVQVAEPVEALVRHRAARLGRVWVQRSATAVSTRTCGQPCAPPNAA